MSDTIRVSVLGQEYVLEKGTPIMELADRLQEHYDADIVMAEYNDRLIELHKKLKEDGNIKFITTTEKNGRRAYRRSLVMLMQAAVEEMYPGENANVKVMHSLGDGYYCKWEDERPVTEEFVTSLKQKMNDMVAADLPIMKDVMKTRNAKKMFAERGMNDKVRLLRYRSSSNINIYDLHGSKDYFYGYMVASTKYLKYFDVVPFDEGFMLLFPDKKDGKTMAPFDPATKLFSVMQESIHWGKMMDVPTIGALNDAIAAGRIQEIILTQEALMEERIGALAREIASDRSRKFVMIAGPSSSGKTTFSHRLSIQLSALGLKPHPVGLDNYYLNRDQMPLDEFGEKDFEALEGIDIELFNSDMNKLLAGERVELPTFNFKIGKREYRGNYMQLGPEDVLVIEGIHGLNDRLSYSLPAESKFKIYISALTHLAIDEHNPLPTTDGRLIRRIVRDSRTRGTSAQETIAMWDSVRRGEEKNIFPFQEKADAMFNSALIYELAALKVYAQPQLYAIEPGCPEYAEANRLLKLLDYVLPIPTEGINNNSLIREFIGGSCFNV